jgi:hypothetical protein
MLFGVALASHSYRGGFAALTVVLVGLRCGAWGLTVFVLVAPSGPVATTCGINGTVANKAFAADAKKAA